MRGDGVTWKSRRMPRHSPNRASRVQERADAGGPAPRTAPITVPTSANGSAGYHRHPGGHAGRAAANSRHRRRRPALQHLSKTQRDRPRIDRFSKPPVRGQSTAALASRCWRWRAAARQPVTDIRHRISEVQCSTVGELVRAQRVGPASTEPVDRPDLDLTMRYCRLVLVPVSTAV